MKHYFIYTKHPHVTAVKNGFSNQAAVFTWVWAIFTAQWNKALAGMCAFCVAFLLYLLLTRIGTTEGFARVVGT